MENDPLERAQDRGVASAEPSRRAVAASIATCWLLYLAFIATRLAILRFPKELPLLERHVLTCCVGAGLTWMLYLVLRTLEGAAVSLRAVAATLLALPAALALTLINYEILYGLRPEEVWGPRFLKTLNFRTETAARVLDIYSVFVAWATLYTSVSSAMETQEALRRAAVFQAESRTAELRALRYQLNPHFLFNALNTVSALVMRGDTNGADKTIQALSQFLRSALVTQRAEDTTLAEELDLQRLYLEIEQVRYGDRLHVNISVPASLRSALLPPLLLQPVVENVIHHAVAPSRATVTMTIAARAENDCLHMLVEDDGCNGPALAGTEIGLRNVAARLATRYGEAGRCEHGPRPGGGYRVELVLPLRMQAGAG